MNTPEHNHYLILLPNGRYMCVENSKIACIYHYTDLNSMRYDLNMSGGELVAFTKDRKKEIFLGLNYDNEEKSIDALELLEELRGIARYTNTLTTYERAL